MFISIKREIFIIYSHTLILILKWHDSLFLSIIIIRLVLLLLAVSKIYIQPQKSHHQVFSALKSIPKKGFLFCSSDAPFTVPRSVSCLPLCTINSGQIVKNCLGEGASISLLLYPLGIVKISLGICYIQLLLKKVTGHLDPSIEWPGVLSTFYP